MGSDLKVKGEKLRFLSDTAEDEILIPGDDTGGNGNAGESFKVKGTKLYWTDNNGDIRSKEGALTGNSRAAGNVKVKGETILYGDISDAERALAAIVVTEIGASRDTMLNVLQQGTNYGSQIFMLVRDYLGEGSEDVALVSFDVSALAGKTVTAAVLRLTLFSIDGIGNTHWCYKLLHTDWVEDEVTWDEKSSGVAWTSGDFSASDLTVTDGDSAIVPSSGAVEWDIAALVQDAIDNTISLNLVIVGISPETLGPSYVTKEHGSAGSRPKLTVSYTD